jgi:hypothetical protein
MRSVLVMVTNILGEQSLQMAFIQRNNMVQQVSSTASHPPKIDYAASFEFAFGGPSAFVGVLPGANRSPRKPMFRSATYLSLYSWIGSR